MSKKGKALRIVKRTCHTLALINSNCRNIKLRSKHNSFVLQLEIIWHLKTKI